MNDITVSELKTKIESKDDFIFIDVREPAEFAEHNLGATLIPLGTLPAKIIDFQDSKDLEIIVHCRSGARSHQAKQFLIRSGFNNVRNLLGGILEYEKQYGPHS